MFLLDAVCAAEQRHVILERLHPAVNSRLNGLLEVHPLGIHLAVGSLHLSGKAILTADIQLGKAAFVQVCVEVDLLDTAGNGLYEIVVACAGASVQHQRQRKLACKLAEEVKLQQRRSLVDAVRGPDLVERLRECLRWDVLVKYVQVLTRVTTVCAVPVW